MDLYEYIRNVPDFPKPGIQFKDIMPLVGDAKAFKEAISQMKDILAPLNVDYIVSMEARGFIFGAPLAIELGVGFVPLRKPGKLPYKVKTAKLTKEYGEDILCIHEDAIPKGARVALVDDLLATGGTAKSAVELVESLGGEVVCALFLIELLGLEGRKPLKGYDVKCLLEIEVDE